MRVKSGAGLVWSLTVPSEVGEEQGEWGGKRWGRDNMCVFWGTGRERGGMAGINILKHEL